MKQQFEHIKYNHYNVQHDMKEVETYIKVQL